TSVTFCSVSCSIALLLVTTAVWNNVVFFERYTSSAPKRPCHRGSPCDGSEALGAEIGRAPKGGRDSRALFRHGRFRCGQRVPLHISRQLARFPLASEFFLNIFLTFGRARAGARRSVRRAGIRGRRSDRSR